MNITIEQAERWARDLESGKYKQCRTKMVDRDDSHCCLDVLTRYSVPSIPSPRSVIYPCTVGLLSALWNDRFIYYNDADKLSFIEIAEKIRTELIPFLMTRDSYFISYFKLSDY